jgi:hypothetical protein
MIGMGFKSVAIAAPGSGFGNAVPLHEPLIRRALIAIVLASLVVACGQNEPVAPRYRLPELAHATFRHIDVSRGAPFDSSPMHLQSAHHPKDVDAGGEQITVVVDTTPLRYDTHLKIDSISVTFELLSKDASHARVQLEELRIAIAYFIMNHGYAPDSDSGLSMLVSDCAAGGPYLDKPFVPLDPWGNKYRYHRDSVDSSIFRIWSAGRDGTDFSADDVGLTPRNQ